MKKIMIKAEKISKRYQLGKLGSGRLREDFNNWFRQSFRKDRSIGTGEGSLNALWALRNVSFEIAEGEVLGLIGNNGAGKSTLLKIISRITTPSSGWIKGNGRIASLLEVGTGFHGELSGRENIFLNGHILGMKKKEITARFDEIVDFSGVEKFIDTPVKRYSSGMYTRLAFAVAAYLDPEILIVDEVLAVGDAEFQRKCIKKMKEVSSQNGKTILFVSHNMQALQNLCHRVMTLQRGEIADIGDPESVIQRYLSSSKQINLCREFETKDSAPGNDSIRIQKVALIPGYVEGQRVIDIRTPLTIRFEFWYLDVKPGSLIVGVQLFNFSGDCIFNLCSGGLIDVNGRIEGTTNIPGHFLNDGYYYISIEFIKEGANRLFSFESCLAFEVADYRKDTAWYGKWMGYVRPSFPVSLLLKEPLLIGTIHL